MGNNEADKSSREGKEAKEPKTPASQEQNSAAAGAVTADWSGFQAYSPMPPHGFMASSPQAPPYMWGVQQFMPPYGTPPHPYVAMYPHGAMYGHPAMTPGSYHFSPFAMPSPNGVAEASGNTPINMEVDGKSSHEKGKLPIKRSKGSLGNLNMINGKNNEPGKASGASANGVSKSGESASRSSDGSDENSQNESPNRGQDSGEPSQNGSGTQSSQNGGSSAPHSMVNHSMTIMPMPAANAVGPTTNLNIGMDYWGTATSAAVPVMHGKVPATPVQGGMIPNGSRDSVQSQLWMQDERELKKERRKQSNRESARRSRLRKQAECEELAKRAEVLNEENLSLRTEMARLKRDYEQLLAQNASLKEKLGQHPGQEDPSSSHGDQNTGIDVEHSRHNDHSESDQ